MLVDHHVVQLQVSVRQAHSVKISHTIKDLSETACHLGFCHSARHHNCEQVEWSVLHNLIPVAPLLNDIEGPDDIAVVKSRTDAELRRDLLGILLHRLPAVAVSELFDGKDDTVRAALQQANRTSGSGSQDSTEFPILGVKAMVLAERNGFRDRLVRGSLGNVVRGVLPLMPAGDNLEEALEFSH